MAAILLTAPFSPHFLKPFNCRLENGVELINGAPSSGKMSTAAVANCCVCGKDAAWTIKICCVRCG
eukprot:5774210-Ditylum_brightwellii.AAC.1